MTRWIPYALAAAALVAIACAAIWIGREPSGEEPSPEWLIQAEAPTIFGGGEAAYGYGGSEAYPASGGMEISWTPGRGGTIDFRIELDEDVRTFLGSTTLRGSASLDAESPVFEERMVLGGTGLGSAPLPPTRACLAGTALFEITAAVEDRENELASIHGWWMVADALRRSDGAVRQSGLIYSPLLRDQSGFSDATRTEATLILGDAERPLLQVVFSEVRVVQSPSRTTSD